MERPKGWHSRGYLPHFEGGEIPQFITFRLADSVPQELLRRWRRELAAESAGDWEAAYRRRVELYLDQGYGQCYLRDPRVATMTQDALLHFDAARFHLRAWVIMPNHLHLLLTPLPGHKISMIMHSRKLYTAREANKILNRAGQFWQRDYFDRYIRDEKHFKRAWEYIEQNPVKAKLCTRAEDWPWSSASVRAQKREFLGE